MKKSLPLHQLLIAALGVVYGDIGTSPLYALKKAFETGDFAINTCHTFGIISLLFWAFILVVSIKYVGIILKADNHGEGGILALSSLCKYLASKKQAPVIVIMGLLGASLFYGDGIITPAISVLGALEGIALEHPQAASSIPYMAIGALLILFTMQKRGSQWLGMLFGPIMFLWFLMLGALGLVQIIKNPDILRALNPYYAYHFFQTDGWHALTSFGAIVLVLTGAEALYADLGHFGKRPIRISWFFIVFPSLILNYLGQGSMIMMDAAVINNPFYYLVSKDWLYPLIILSTIATFVASQAVISGVYSLTFQAIQLGLLPRMRIIHTSAHQFGQVYAPFVNLSMLIMAIVAVLIFRSSDNMASAYGITVTGIMVITTLLAFFLSVVGWKWSPLRATLVFTPLLLIDCAFLGTNALKIMDGGWFQILITGLVFAIVTTWQKGRQVIQQANEEHHEPLDTYIKKLNLENERRIPGTAIFMTRQPNEVPSTLRLQLRHNKFLHEKLIFITIEMSAVPYISHQKRIEKNLIIPSVYQVTCHYGYKEIVNLPAILERLMEEGVAFDMETASLFISRGQPIAHHHRRMYLWQEKLFIFLSHNVLSAADFFKMPHKNVVELGSRFRI